MPADICFHFVRFVQGILQRRGLSESWLHVTQLILGYVIVHAWVINGFQMNPKLLLLQQ
jgi:hypothetical protein